MITVKTIDQVKSEMTNINDRLVQYYKFSDVGNGVQIRRENGVIIRCTTTSYGGENGLYELTAIPNKDSKAKNRIIGEITKMAPLGWQPLLYVVALAECTAVYTGMTSVFTSEELTDFIDDNLSKMIEYHMQQKQAHRTQIKTA